MKDDKATVQPAPVGQVERPVMQHTPGPWSYSEEPRNGIATVASVEHWVIGRDYGSPEMAIYDHHGPAEADARLIAAAPDMLNALRSLLRHAERMSEIMDEECGIRFRDDGPTAMARDALARAVGAA